MDSSPSSPFESTTVPECLTELVAKLDLKMASTRSTFSARAVATANAIATNITNTQQEEDNPAIKRCSTKCGNEKYLKGPGIFKLCSKLSTIVCPTCGLVEYCSDNCRFDHFEAHAGLCNPVWASESWAPDQKNLERAAKEKQKEQEDGVVRKVFLWGDRPACDLMTLVANDPAMYENDINLLLPISGDIRHSIITINNLPLTYSKTIDLTLNDPDVTIVIRNALLLMTSFVYRDKVEAAHTMLELWYSAALHHNTWKKLRFELLPFVERAYAKKIGPASSTSSGAGSKAGGKSNNNSSSSSASRKPTSQVSHRWTKKNASLRLTLTRRQWKRMLDMLQDGGELDFKKAMAARKSVVEDPARKVHNEKTLSTYPARFRRAHVRWLQTGMLLPFGHTVGEFDVANPTLFTPEGTYLNAAENTPLDGWPLPSVFQAGADADVLKNDIYGALYQHVGASLFHFCSGLEQFNTKLNFHLYSVETSKLDGTLGNNKPHHVNGLAFMQVGKY